MLIISWVLTHSPSWRKFCSAEIVCHKIGLSFNRSKSEMLVFGHHSQHPSIASVPLSNQVCIAFSTVSFTYLVLPVASNLRKRIVKTKFCWKLQFRLSTKNLALIHNSGYMFHHYEGREDGVMTELATFDFTIESDYMSVYFLAQTIVIFSLANQKIYLS